MNAAGLIETMVVDGLWLRPRPLPAELARAGGVWKGGAVTITARVYEGAGVRFARFIDLRGLRGNDLTIANALALPVGDAPILGVDLVSLGGRDGLVVADLSPVRRDHADQDLAPLATRPRASAERAVATLPGWAARWFSPHALCARVPGEDAALLVRPFAETFVTLVRDDAPARGTQQIEAAQSAYLRDHREEDRTLGLLATIFGAPFARRFIDEVMFPIALPLTTPAPGSSGPADQWPVSPPA